MIYKNMIVSYILSAVIGRALVRRMVIIGDCGSLKFTVSRFAHYKRGRVGVTR